MTTDLDITTSTDLIEVKGIITEHVVVPDVNNILFSITRDDTLLPAVYRGCDKELYLQNISSAQKNRSTITANGTMRLNKWTDAFGKKHSGIILDVISILF